MVADLVRAAHLHQRAHVHHADPAADVAHHGQVVGDEQIRYAALGLNALQQVHDLRLNGHVQRRDGLVADDELRVEGQRPCDADALPLSAGKFVGIAPDVVGLEAHRLQQLLHALGALLRVAEPVDLHRLRDQLAHREARVQRGVGVLKDHLHALAVGLHLPVIQVRDLRAAAEDAPGVRLVDLQDGAAQRALAAAALAHQTHGLAAPDGERHAVDGVHHALLAEGARLDVELLHQILHANHRISHALHPALCPAFPRWPAPAPCSTASSTRCGWG